MVNADSAAAFPSLVKDRDQIMGGDLLPVIERKGWSFVREQLEGMTWDPIANTQIEIIKKLRLQPENIKRHLQNEQLLRDDIIACVKKTRQFYSKERDCPYYASTTGAGAEFGGNKLVLVGRSVADFGKEKATRIYTAVTLENIKDSFEQLRKQLHSDGVLGHILLAMNLETLDNVDFWKVDNNAIIICVPDSNPEILTKLANSLKRVKEANKNLFTVPPSQLARVKANATSEFLVPLDNTTWFVEVERERKQKLSYRQFCEYGELNLLG